MQGAPFEMFLSADEGFVFRAGGRRQDRRPRRALCRSAASCSSPRKGSPLKADASLPVCERRLQEGAIRTLRDRQSGARALRPRAEQALQAQGLWEAIAAAARARRERLAGRAVRHLGRGAGRHLRLFAGAGAGGVGARRLCADSRSDWHAPLRQRMVLMKSAGEIAARVLRLRATAGGARDLRAIRVRAAGRSG